MWRYLTASEENQYTVTEKAICGWNIGIKVPKHSSLTCHNNARYVAQGQDLVGERSEVVRTPRAWHNEFSFNKVISEAVTYSQRSNVAITSGGLVVFACRCIGKRTQRYQAE